MKRVIPFNTPVFPFMLPLVAAVIASSGRTVALADVFNMPPGQTSLEFVTVGNPGNAADTRYATPGYGAVAYTFSMGKYEVTAGQYTSFLNAVAATDTYGLYNTNMGSINIQRAGSSGSYTYTVGDGSPPDVSNWANRPVIYVSWGDAARFANWLHNGQPTGGQGLSTTEDGSYFLNGAMSNEALLVVARNANATWVIPSEDEWHKAAYHKNDGVIGNYWDYPTGANTIPNNGNPEGDTGNSANFDDGDFTIGSPYWRTDAGFFGQSGSPYGTFDQCGNVWEFNEAILAGSYRGLRGGSWDDIGSYLHASYRGIHNYPTTEDSRVGFRIAAKDCNGNGIPDTCDINCALPGCESFLGCGQSQDCNTNGSPDECDEPDTDGDNVPDVCDNCDSVVNPNQADADIDGIGDDCDTCTDTDGDAFGDPGYPVNTCQTDNCPIVSNPTQADADNDGIGDACDTCTDTDGDTFGDPGYPENTCQTDNCPTVSNPTQTDTDGDGIGDACDTCTDTDGDGYGNPGFPINTCPMDNCPTVSNPTQSDADNDGTGDACDTCSDTDGDTFGDPGHPENTCQPDNCPTVPNPSQGDADNDGIGDACDTCTDTDGDSFGDPGYPVNTCQTDNCPIVSNPTQTDADNDGIGDACDTCTDTDGDTFGDPGYPENTCQTDNCPTVSNPTQTDTDGDGIGDACDTCTDTDGDGYGNPGFPVNTCPMDNCPTVSNPTQSDADNDGIGDACDTCTDTDGDSFGDPGYPANTCTTDNCPTVSNPGQEDCNNDGVGDACATVGTCGESLAAHYLCNASCPTFSPTFAAPGLLSFAAATLTPGGDCNDLPFRFYAGQVCGATCKIWRIREDCTQQTFNGDLAAPHSLLVDVNAYWPGTCPDANPIIVGGLNIIYFLTQNGTVCETYPDGLLGQVGQMTLDSAGRLLMGSFSQATLWRLDKGSLAPCYTCPNGAGYPSAATMDSAGNIYVVCSGDGILRKLDSDCAVIDGSVATGIEGAASMAFASNGIFHRNLLVACGSPGNRVMEVNVSTGQSSVFLCNLPVMGITFDPAGYMHVTVPTENKVLRVGPGLPGDVDGSGMVDSGDVDGFAKSLIGSPDSPLPIATADMNGDGCTNARDIRPFMIALEVP